MGIPAWVWFVIAAVAAVAGLALLLFDRARRGAVNRERSRWAALRGWQYAESDDRLFEHWAGGAVAYYPDGVARNVAAGSTFTAHGRRPVYVADSVRDGVTDFVLVAVRCRRRLDAYLELWLSNVPLRPEQMPDLLGPVGQRYAFVSDVEATRPLITPDLADVTEQVGTDVNVVWLEGYWVLAAAPPNCSSTRLERLLRDLGDLADLVDPIETARPNPAGAQHDIQHDAQHSDPAQQVASQSANTTQTNQTNQAARAAQSAQASTQVTPSAHQSEPPTQRDTAPTESEQEQPGTSS